VGEAEADAVADADRVLLPVTDDVRVKLPVRVMDAVSDCDRVEEGVADGVAPKVSDAVALVDGGNVRDAVAVAVGVAGTYAHERLKLPVAAAV